jgi:hypothetical protein
MDPTDTDDQLGNQFGYTAITFLSSMFSFLDKELHRCLPNNELHYLKLKLINNQLLVYLDCECLVLIIFPGETDTVSIWLIP